MGPCYSLPALGPQDRAGRTPRRLSSAALGSPLPPGLIPYAPLQASVSSPQRGQPPALFFLLLGAHPHPHFMGDIAEAQSEGTRSGSKEAGSGQGLGKRPLLLSGTLGCEAFWWGDGESPQKLSDLTRWL